MKPSLRSNKSDALSSPFVLWFTGLPCSGKSTLAEKIALALAARGIPVEHLDGDAVRSVLPALGFSAEARNAHVRTMGYIASRLEHHGVVVIASFVSPYKESREFARSICGNFVEVYISTPVEVCAARDVKGMYKKAQAGEIRHFTGIDDPYEAPTAPEVEMDTTERSIESCLEELERYLEERGFLPQASTEPAVRQAGG